MCFSAQDKGMVGIIKIRSTRFTDRLSEDLKECYDMLKGEGELSSEELVPELQNV